MPAPILPISPAPSAIKISLKSRSVTSQSESGKILGRSKGTSYYEMVLNYPPMRRDQFASIAAFLSVNAKPDIFYVKVDPMTGTAGEIVGNHINYHNDTKLHLVAGSPVQAWATATIYSLSEQVQTGGHIYQSKIAALNTGSAPHDVAPSHTSGTVNDWEYLGIYEPVSPPMRNIGGLVVSDPVYMRCSLKNDIQQINLAKDGLVRFEINLVERI